jgi:hypothetical protein
MPLGLTNFTPIHTGAVRIIPGALLWLLHRFGFCAAIVGEYPAYMAGVVATLPHLLNIYVVYPNAEDRMSENETVTLFQVRRRDHFLWGGLVFDYHEEYSVAGDHYVYTVSCNDPCRSE